MGYSPEQKELLDAIQIMIDNTLNAQTTKIYSCYVSDVGNEKHCTVVLNGKTQSVQYYGDTPIVAQHYKLFVPFGNMSQAFIITGGGSGSSGTDDYSQLTNKPSVNSVTLTGNKTSTDLGLYGTGNEPNYPVDSVNGKTGAVVLTSGDIGAVPTSRTVNGKALSSNITLTSSDVGALPDSTIIPTQTSQLTNNSGFITSAQAPVQSVNGKTGTVVLTQDDVGNGSTYVRTQNNYTTADKNKLTGIEAGAQVNKIESVSRNGVTLPITSKNVNVVVPTKTSDLTNDSGFVTSTTAPVRSVNGKTGVVVLDSLDVRAYPYEDGKAIERLDMNGEDIINVGWIKTDSVAPNDGKTNIDIESSITVKGNIDMTGGHIADAVFVESESVRTDTISGKTSNTVLFGSVVLMDGNKITELPTPTDSSDATNKGYVDGQIDTRVPNTRTVNGKALSSNITLNATDVGALPSSTTYVSSVNGQSGAVTLAIPTKTSDLTNDSGFITPSQAPVQSVNGATGAVTITNITGNAATATKATQDGNGSTITSTYAKRASPTLTGTPKAPTATAGTNTTQIATTAFVTTAVTNAGGNVTYLSATAPTSPKTGDTWYQIL